MKAISDRDQLLRMSNYPGMVEAESRILREYIRRHFTGGDEFRFNLRLGEGESLPADVDPAVRRSWEALTKARPDACQWRPPNSARLIEVKEFLTNEGVWQLLTYRDFYVRDFPSHEVTLIAVAGGASHAARQLTKANGVYLYVYAIAPGQVDINADAIEERPDGV